MSKLLLILRHAKSSWDSGAPSDFERPLAPRGERDARRMGEWLDAHKLTPDYVVSSPAARAVQTTVTVCDALNLKKKQIHWEERIYGADVSDLLRVLSDLPVEAERVLLVGHNPGLEELLTLLWGDGTVIPANGKLLPTAALAQVELPDEWQDLSAGTAQRVAVTRPKEID